MILIPSLNEGEALIGTVESLVNQNYRGNLVVQVLIQDEADSSYQFLIEKYGFTEREVTRGQKELFFESGNRKVSILLTGLKKKDDKLNFALDVSKTSEHQADFIGILDADHRAHPNWVASSLNIFEQNSFSAVQSIRKPLDSRKFFQFWDSAENHLGNEVLNHVFKKWKLSSFFTGTTCIFKKEVFEQFQFPDSITEDTYLSYQLLTSEHKIGYNSEFGSFEEVAPDFNSYLSRRRRWSSGHNQTFFSHFFQIFSSENKLSAKIQFSFHSAYFLIPSLIVFLLNLYGLYSLVQLTNNVILSAFTLSILSSLFLSYFVSNSLKELAQNTFLGFFLFFPLWSLFSPTFYKSIGDQLFFQLLSFPYMQDFALLHIFLILLPLIILSLGCINFGLPRPKYLLMYFWTFPFILFLDIYAGFLGLFDYFLKRKIWGKIRRQNSIEQSHIPSGIIESAGLQEKGGASYKKMLALPVALAGFITINDFLVFENCGHPQYLIQKPFIFNKSNFETNLKIDFQKSSNLDTEKATLNGIFKLYRNTDEPIRLSYSIGNKQFDYPEAQGKEISLPFKEILSLGFEKYNLDITVKSASEVCLINKKISSTVKEVKDGRLFLNGEPFLIKGLIPSFRTAKINLSLKNGLKQIKRAGANTVRFYHRPTKEILELSEELGLMLIVQPDETTWGNLNLSSKKAEIKLESSYKDLVYATMGHPYILIDHIGNELELKTNSQDPYDSINNALKDIKKEDHYRFPVSYATYLTYRKYPLDILGLNMLDSGETYWEHGLNLALNLHPAFYASELGGFVAFTEKLHPELRKKRLKEQWQLLLNKKASGAVFFQSHDNWAQPLSSGYNDPLNPEHPDDLRGFWDHENNPKPELTTLKEIFQDFEIEPISEEGRLRIRNKRDYKISDLVADFMSEKIPLSDIGPNQVLDFDIPNFSVGENKLLLSYTTHSGLPHEIEYNFEKDDLNYDPIQRNSLSSVKWSTDQKSWRNFDSSKVPEGVEVFFKINLPQNLEELKNHSLLLEGLGGSNLKFYNESGIAKRIRVHSYRETRVKLSKLKNLAAKSSILTFSIKRNQTTYVHSRYTLSQKPIQSVMKRPRLELIDFNKP